MVADLPGPVRAMGRLYLEQIAQLTEIIDRLGNERRTASRRNSSLRLDAISILPDGETRYQVTGTKPWKPQFSPASPSAAK